MHPFDNYLQALDAHQKNDPKEAAQKIAEAVGTKKATYQISSSLNNILKQGTPLHNGVLHLMTVEARKKKNGK